MGVSQGCQERPMCLACLNRPLQAHRSTSTAPTCATLRISTRSLGWRSSSQATVGASTDPALSTVLVLLVQVQYYLQYSCYVRTRIKAPANLPPRAAALFVARALGGCACASNHSLKV